MRTDETNFTRNKIMLCVKKDSYEEKVFRYEFFGNKQFFRVCNAELTQSFVRLILLCFMCHQKRERILNRKVEMVQENSCEITIVRASTKCISRRSVIFIDSELSRRIPAAFSRESHSPSSNRDDVQLVHGYLYVLCINN